MAQRHEWVDLRYAPGRQVTRQASDEQDAKLGSPRIERYRISQYISARKPKSRPATSSLE